MNSNAVRSQATLVDHTLVMQDWCVYCGNRGITPRLFTSGHTTHLDHFIPVSIIALARKWHPEARFNNFLLPCCLFCNVYLGQLVFSCFKDKFDFIRSRRQELRRLSAIPNNPQDRDRPAERSGRAKFDRPGPSDWLQNSWDIAHNPQLEQLQSIQRPSAMASIISADLTKPGYVIVCPQRRGGRWIGGEECERILCL
jgi:hypothetical protein